MTDIFNLRENQLEAINKSIENDFSCGIHYHATGTGKSWIGILLLYEFNKRYPQGDILWICERKDILKQQFNKETIKNRGFSNILKKFNVLDFSINKEPKWYDSLNSSIFWGKPFLCIINRSFLTSKKKYQNIKKGINLVIHDECHSIENSTTSEFYNWLQKRNELLKIPLRVIGFSATPEYIKPIDNVISKYSIYDAYLDNVILPPKIIWLKSEIYPTIDHLIYLLKTEIDKLYYKKIIVWCGMIEECIKTANLWKKYFKDYTFCIDFCNINSVNVNNSNMNNNINNYKDFEYFYNTPKNTILFCAVKHREGSDIPNIDGCIFMDLVSQRSERVFIQCMGRVLRKDLTNNKKYGLVIDLKAKSTIDVCNRVQYYLKLENIFPWNYSINRIVLDNRSYFINMLDMKNGKIKSKQIIDREYSKDEIKNYFIRTIPNNKKYHTRLEYELDLIINKNIFGNILRAIEILDLTKNIPHVTRGSCGSSLVCYLLGISHMDPIEHNISFARFLNKYRNTLPDIDFDFPHYLRDEVFLKLYQKWGNKVARISNHNYYHEKSALREAIRRNGIHKFISKYDIQKEINSYDKELKRNIYSTQRELLGTFRGFSLHCGGIIYFPEGIPQENILETNRSSILHQVNLNRDNVSQNKNFKIDILSSRALSQLYYCHSFQDIDFNSNINDTKTIELLQKGDNIGITLSETPLMRKALLLVKPKSIMDVAICLSIIRPAAKDARKEFELGKFRNNSLVFDDDVIDILSKLIGCDQELADKLRRGYCKDDKDTMKILDKVLNNKHPSVRFRIRSILKNLRKYGFCKAHALSYAQLVWQLAYQKAHYPKKFWESTLKNIETYYRKWVHIYEAKCNGVDIKIKEKHQSIYATNKNKKVVENINKLEQLRKYGYWNMEDELFFPNCYHFNSNGYEIFRGLIASSRTLNYNKNKQLIVFVGVDKQKYIEIVIKNPNKFDSQKVIVKGKGKLKNNIYGTIECYGNNIEFI